MDFILDPSLVLYLPLYEKDGGSFMPRDHYGHLATVTGAVWTPRGRSFDGTDDYINCGTPNPLKFGTGDFSIEFWAYVPAIAATPALMSKGYHTVDYNGNWIIRSHNLATIGLEFRVHDGQSPVYAVNCPDFQPLRGNWRHIVQRRSSGVVKPFIDGIERAREVVVGTEPFTGNIGSNTHDLWLGNDPLNEWLNGYIGEVRIYNRALTALEIQQNYLATKWRY